MVADRKIGFKEKMKTKLVLLSTSLSVFGLIGFAGFNLVSAQTGKQATVKEKAALTQLVLQDKEVKEAMTGEGGLSVDDITKGIIVKKIDLNKDGQPEYLVTLEVGYFCGAHANCPDWVYRKTGGEYQLLLRTFGQQLLLQRTSTNSFRDLRSEGASSAFETDFSIYKFDGNKYQAKACYSRIYSAQGRKPKITRIKCEEGQ
ncbi:MAG: hypothetical protein QOJ02_2853 [Acidobacteriota bacterium]|nr:hypothetical protein [Acidobacteriota bacterium]